MFSIMVSALVIVPNTVVVPEVREIVPAVLVRLLVTVELADIVYAFPVPSVFRL